MIARPPKNSNGSGDVGHKGRNPRDGNEARRLQYCNKLGHSRYARRSNQQNAAGPEGQSRNYWRQAIGIRQRGQRTALVEERHGWNPSKSWPKRICDCGGLHINRNPKLIFPAGQTLFSRTGYDSPADVVPRGRMTMRKAIPTTMSPTRNQAR